MTASTAFGFKVFGIASLLASSILIAVLVAQRPGAASKTSVVDTGTTMAGSLR
jgi:hypothetical protein